MTALQPHPNRTNKYKNLVLTSSLDWSIKLWNLTNFSEPVFEFFTSSYEYVCDVQWCVHGLLHIQHKIQSIAACVISSNSVCYHFILAVY